MQQALQDVLAKRRDRAIAILLGFKERELDQHIPAMTSTKLRKITLDLLNDYHDLVIDIMGSLDTGDVSLNQHWLEKLDQIHSTVVGQNGKHPKASTDAS